MVWPARASLAGLLALLVVVILLPTVAAADPADDAVRRVALQLRCPVCEGQTVWDSGAKLAGDMRDVIRAKQAAGESDQQILDSFVAAYGDGILSDPPKRGVSLGVWFGPIIAVVGGLAILAVVLRQWRQAGPAAAGPAAPTAADPDVLDELGQLRQKAL